ncbi:membrane integrity-associated transporter subunit PqiC [Xenorhabdus eapokensis]|uniref:Membrane protein n=1 Tax=Xenorhabdus eapokensis TaxID=1873482 RepID=A0A1Q5TYQ7_9GAMM|nr:membrane integrity-associated transporter subunit PqiC [Xenorhabdus eapokensis]OKP05354.1 membrane protein [Xenorhabdus eapokensis]
MKKLISKLAFFMSVSVLISGCSSSQPQKTYYQLPALANLASQEGKWGAKRERQLWIKRVALSDYLTAPGIVYQTGEVSYINASNHLWASPLQQQLQQTLISELSAAFPHRLVSQQKLEKGTDALDITITAFHGRYDGQVVIEGYWLLSNLNRVIRRPFSLKLKQEKDGYAELVLTLAKGYSQLAKSIASQLSLQG